MAHLPQAEIQARRAAARQDILSQWEQNQGYDWYALSCPCVGGQNFGCNHQPEEEVPHIVLTNCLYVGELDALMVEDPFAEYGFRVMWLCIECETEFACGIPLGM